MGKWLLITGLIIAFFGILVILLERTGLFRLPGDLQFGSENWKVFIPVTSSILLSLILTGLIWLISVFFRR